MARSASILLVAALTAVAMAPVRAETFVLAGGGRIEGRLMNPGEVPRENFVIRTPQGGTVTLAKALVAQVVTKTPAQIEYDALLPRVTADAEAHWKMAEWCRKQDGMEKQREFHMQKVIDFDPDHEGARRGLGYSQVDGKWVKPEEHMESMGHVRSGGAWRTPQEVALETARKQRDQAGTDWKIKISRWSRALSQRKAAEALQELKAIRDPVAAIALAELMNEEGDASLRRLYVDILTRLPPGAASSVLVNAALTDGDEQVRDQAMRTLGQWGPPMPTAMLIRALKNKDDMQMVHRAGLILAAVQDPEATLPLIEALTTKIKIEERTSGGPGAIGASFGSGGTGFSAGGSGKKVSFRDHENPGVLSALLALSGGDNFRYDKAAWRKWYAEKNAPQRVNLRRDE